jgi:hypothetical protein
MSAVNRMRGSPAIVVLSSSYDVVRLLHTLFGGKLLGASTLAQMKTFVKDLDMEITGSATAVPA